MTVVDPPKAVNLSQLEAELTTAGVQIRGLAAHGSSGPQSGPPLVSAIFTYDANVQEVDLPPAAASVIAAHVPQPTELDVSATDLNTNYQAALTRLDAIINATSMTQAQAVTAIQDEARMLRRLLRFVFNAVPPKRP